MSNLNWCTYCDKAVSPFSESLYCSEDCLRADALRNHPLLGYTYPEFTDFPHPKLTSSNSYCQPLPRFPTTTKITKTSHQHLYMFSSMSTSPSTTIASSSSSSSRSSSCSSIIPLNTTTDNHAFI